MSPGRKTIPRDRSSASSSIFDGLEEDMAEGRKRTVMLLAALRAASDFRMGNPSSPAPKTRIDSLFDMMETFNVNARSYLHCFIKKKESTDC